MKIKIQPILVLSVCILIYSCKSTRTVTIDTLRPAELTLPSDVNTILLVDRTKFKKGILDVGEGLLTGELPGEDKAAVQNALSSLRNRIMTAPRFQVKIAPERMIGNSLTPAFPDPIHWNTISSLCRNNNAEAIVAIELFDSDFIVTDGVRQVEKQVKSGDSTRTVIVDEFYAEGVGSLKMGIRLYYPRNKDIMDQQYLTHTNTWNSAANSKAQALANLVNKVNATIELSSFIASNYAFRISPMPIKLSRFYYKKSKNVPGVERGSRRAEVNDWEGAKQIWMKSMSGIPYKDAGLVSYNIAVAYEVLGNYDEAKKWAQQSYSQYGNKRARSYVATLEDRMFQEQRVDQQFR